MVDKHKQEKKRNFKTYRKRNKEQNALIEKKFQKCVKNKKRRKTEKRASALQPNTDSDNESKKKCLQHGS